MDLLLMLSSIFCWCCYKGGRSTSGHAAAGSNNAANQMTSYPDLHPCTTHMLVESKKHNMLVTRYTTFQN